MNDNNKIITAKDRFNEIVFDRNSISSVPQKKLWLWCLAHSAIANCPSNRVDLFWIMNLLKLHDLNIFQKYYSMKSVYAIRDLMFIDFILFFLFFLVLGVSLKFIATHRVICINLIYVIKTRFEYKMLGWCIIIMISESNLIKRRFKKVSDIE